MKKLAILAIALFSFVAASARPICGAERVDVWKPILKDKKVCVLTNYSALVGKNYDRHLLDVMIEEGINIVAIATPEHGLSGKADAGAKVSSSTYEKNGVSIPIWSLFGKNRKMSVEQAKQFDVLVFDIQDVGVRFFTYYVTMLYTFDALAQEGKKLVVMDRPNPNGMYCDGPILDMKRASFVGALPIPVVHGLTMGELAKMAVGEGWYPKIDIEVVKCKNYTHQTRYQLPIKPGPNVRTMQAVYLYPSSCLIEGTVFSEARGTEFGFEAYGHPDIKPTGFSYIPRSIEGATNPKHLDKECHGVDLRNIPKEQIIKEGFTLKYVIDAYNRFGGGDDFFGKKKYHFMRLVGADYVYDMIMAGKSADEIKAVWQKDLEAYKELRRKYLLYKE